MARCIRFRRCNFMPAALPAWHWVFHARCWTRSSRWRKQKARHGRPIRCATIMPCSTSSAMPTLPGKRRGPACTLALDAAWQDVSRTGVLSLAHRMEIRQAATYAIHASRDMAHQVFHEAGSTAIFNKHPFERRLRDVNSVSQQLQGRRTHFETVGCYRLGRTKPRTCAGFSDRQRDSVTRHDRRTTTAARGGMSMPGAAMVRCLPRCVCAAVARDRRRSGG